VEIRVVRQILEWNEDCSASLREKLSFKKVFMINVMGSPGAGKTSLITSVIERLKVKGFRIGVVEGDIAGNIDAKKMDALGIPVVQLNTDGACHIEAMAIDHILPMFDLDDTDIIFIENIGNLVCPAEFDLGEDMCIGLLSVPEGDDKIEKYPLLFSRVDILAVSKIDMLSFFDFDLEKVKQLFSDVNPKALLIPVSVKDGSGIEKLCDEIIKKASHKLQ